METLAIALGSLALYLVAYHTYGRWLARKIFKLNPDAKTPSVELEDGKDYVPTSKSIVFGHHFTSIAGTGPIVGPSVAVIWGWVPALLWVLFGSIFIGAVHDFGALVVSMRNKGQTVGDIAGRVLVPRARILFLGILFLALTIVLAIFGLVIAAVFRQFPQSIIACLLQIPLAIGIGYALHKRGASIFIPSLLVLGLMYLTVYFGDTGFLHSCNVYLSQLPIMTWVVLLLAYSYVASVLPVWILLQPRDYINSLQLLSVLALIVLGLVVAAFFGGAPIGELSDVRPALELEAAAFRPAPEGAPWIFPFLFVTIACGAISGFHCLVSSGTSSKQLKTETDAQFVGFGSMLTEGFLAVLVILACTAGLGLGMVAASGEVLQGEAAYLYRYADWNAANGLAAKIGAFVDGSANFLMALGIPTELAIALMGVFVASFAATTLDTSCRLQRYVVQELARALGGEKQNTLRKKAFAWLENKHAAILSAIAVAVVLAAVPPGSEAWTWEGAGKGGLILWPLFGATNQLIGGLAFIVVAFWMWRRKLPVWFIVFPMALMLLLPAVAMLINLFGANGYWATERWLLFALGLASIAFEVWIIVEACIAWPKAKGVLEDQAS
ncbi:carbon starvation protein A [bacterium]|nr:carbon starvation protein A [bacterium]